MWKLIAQLHQRFLRQIKSYCISVMYTSQEISIQTLFLCGPSVMELLQSGDLFYSEGSYSPDMLFFLLCLLIHLQLILLKLNDQLNEQKSFDST